MNISTFFSQSRQAGKATKCASVSEHRVRRYLSRHHLTDAECNDLRDYYHRNDVKSPAIMTAALGGHPFEPTRRR